MDYNITMPQLSDSMSEGKLVEWKVQEGQEVKSGDVIADIESDKAVIEVQTFKDGVVKKLLLKEGDEAKVGSVIAIIDTDKSSVKSSEEVQKEPVVKKSDEKQSKKEESAKQEKSLSQPPKTKINEDKEDIIDFLFENDKTTQTKPLVEGVSTPVAKQKAQSLGIDIKKLQDEGKLPVPSFEKDIDEAAKDRYFTAKAKKLFDEYALELSDFKLNHKINVDEVEKYIEQQDIPKKVKLTTNQKSVINTVTNSWKRPVYHIFEEVTLQKKEGIKVTANILKALANSMQKYPFSRSVLQNDTLYIYPNSNISVALSRGKELYMVVLKNVQHLSLKDINSWLKEIKTKKLTSEDVRGSTFGISNLGMFKIDSFDALINANDAGIAAFGAIDNGKMKVTFTFDHRIVNGAVAAQFVMDFKEELKNV